MQVKQFGKDNAEGFKKALLVLIFYNAHTRVQLKYDMGIIIDQRTKPSSKVLA